MSKPPPIEAYSSISRAPLEFPNAATGWRPAPEAWLRITGERRGEVEISARFPLLHAPDNCDDQKPPMVALDYRFTGAKHRASHHDDL